MDLTAIRHFVQVADAGSITRAAAQLQVAQPAVTRRIAALERDLGQTLLVRMPRGVRLTGAGVQFLEHSRRVLRELDRARDEMRGQAEVPRGRVTLGVSPTLGPMLLPGIVERVRKQCPGVSLKIVEGFSVLLYDQLLDGRLDVGVITNPAPSRALALTPLLSEPLVVLAPPQPRGTRRYFTLAELLRTPVIITDGIRLVVEEQLARHGARLLVDSEIDAVEAIRRLLLRGIGTTVMPVSTFREDIRAGRISAYQVADASLHRLLVLAHPEAGRHTAAVAEVSRQVKAEIDALAAEGTFALPPPGEVEAAGRGSRRRA